MQLNPGSPRTGPAPETRAWDFHCRHGVSLPEGCLVRRGCTGSSPGLQSEEGGGAEVSGAVPGRRMLGGRPALGRVWAARPGREWGRRALHEGWGQPRRGPLPGRRVPGQPGDPERAVGERGAGKQGMLGGGWVSRPPARRIAPPSPLKLPQEAVVSSKKMGGDRGAGWAKVKLPILIPAAFPGSYPPSPSHFSESEN